MAAGRVTGALITRPPPLPWTAAIPLAGWQRLEAAGPAGIRAVECGFSVHRRTEGYDEVIDNEDRRRLPGVRPPP
ncbi:hypothetical protein OG799_07610 [Micromonospora sp. NBC_00898]|uniref:hypothetical protein n=1 Tax=Micromonospora sp. NBC_00898 TaxID=2975981 RepID=UPI00386B4E0D|nr:hypothetical protein OG799_07610 [Micromonospora sp. NBC_00898]